ncbi:hypothetical protein B0H11DRAFT_1930886 [Mycena galericulata]|nr:hypothetical protein B0H11DRAFT_1930886 [Mycena galericulata]
MSPCACPGARNGQLEDMNEKRGVWSRGHANDRQMIIVTANVRTEPCCIRKWLRNKITDVRDGPEVVVRVHNGGSRAQSSLYDEIREIAMVLPECDWRHNPGDCAMH